VEELELEKKPNSLKYFAIALLVILIDQTSKLLVQKYMYLHEEITVLGYADGRYGFKLHYLLNPGMAFGIRWDSEFGKLALTIFRIVAMFAIGYYLLRSVRKKIHYGFLVALSMILGGAIGNVIDSTFYGVLFQNHPLDSVTPWFHGQVIDMLFFPLVEFTWPSWIPCGGDTIISIGSYALKWASWMPCGGTESLFFSPVFNIADSSIFIGVTTILIFQKKFFPIKEDGESIPEGDQPLIEFSGENRVRLIGTYQEEQIPDVVLIELAIQDERKNIDFGQITQVIEGKDKMEWQVPWDEKFLDSTGENIIGEPLSPNENGIVRTVFFFHYINVSQPLLTQYGAISIANPTSMPERLKNIIRYQSPH